MLISEEYRKLNKQMHVNKKGYGSHGQRWANHVLSLAKAMKSEDVLDYGCGKSTLAANMPFDIKQYDPAIEKHSVLPEPADLLVCTDVLEHIEPACIDDVLNDIYSLSKKGVFLVIHNGPAVKHLPDGRNAHLIQQNEIWWLGALLPRFELLTFTANAGEEHSEEKNVIEYLIAATPRKSFVIKEDQDEKPR
tara:strand:+ start:23514 stop:24089 length:576 start_codon:yes stop_codon:yes gene_type:complete